ncbi:MAG: hypothetical protein MUO34_12610 [Ignavibacteriaceae bacterium]|nr:hypothetical protein [Ignavibacteriaceae bacterium]
MRLKLKFGIFGIIFLSTLVFLSGCLEEPTIAPAKRPYSVMKVINLSNSSNKIFIDGEQVDDIINVPFTTVYFDINSGARRFVILDANQDTIFNNNIEIISFEREIVIFGGTYDDVSENSTFSNMKISEGEIYFNAMPDPGQVHITLANAFPGYYSGGAEVNPVNFAVRAVYWPNPDSTAIFDTLTYILLIPGTDDAEHLKFGIPFTIRNADPGSYKFLFTNAADSSFVVADSAYYTADRRYYLYPYGNPDVFSIYRNEVESLPIRSIYE